MVLVNCIQLGLCMLMDGGRDGWTLLAGSTFGGGGSSGGGQRFLLLDLVLDVRAGEGEDGRDARHLREFYDGTWGG